MKQPSLDIVIVNWNAGHQLHNCVASISKAITDQFILQRVVVVDNASTDNSIKLLENLSDLPLQIIHNTENKGFGFACNQGAQNSQSDYILFLNPDTQLYVDSLAKPLEFMEDIANAKVGILGVQLIDNQKKISRTCARFPKPQNFIYQMLGLANFSPKIFSSHMMMDWNHDDNRLVDHVMGAYFLVRKKVFEQVKGFDERYFVYLEDLDFSLTAKKLGWNSYFLSDVKIYHKGGGTSEQIKARRLFYSLQSRILYCYKHYNPINAALVAALTLTLEPFTRMTLAMFKRSLSQMSETLAGYRLLYSHLDSVLSSRGLSAGSRHKKLDPAIKSRDDSIAE